LAQQADGTAVSSDLNIEVERRQQQLEKWWWSRKAY